jgi:uncharacterized protein (DUF488 family)
MSSVYTIGHSTREIEEFIALLKEHDIPLLIDVRRFPGSRRHPQFNKEAFAQSLKDADIDYRHMKILGGRRNQPEKNSANDGWRSEGFRAYADYLNTHEGQKAMSELVELSRNTVYALMCAEALYWRCHRQLIADALLAREINVYHIMHPGEVDQHSLNDMAQIVDDGRIIYPKKQQSLFDDQDDQN